MKLENLRRVWRIRPNRSVSVASAQECRPETLALSCCSPDELFADKLPCRHGKSHLEILERGLAPHFDPMLAIYATATQPLPRQFTPTHMGAKTKNSSGRASSSWTARQESSLIQRPGIELSNQAEPG